MTLVDTFAAESQARAGRALARSAFSRSIVPVIDVSGLVVLTQDEFPRPDTTAGSLASLRPSFAAMGEQSVRDQQAIEAGDSMPFEVYRLQYTSPERLGLSKAAIAPALAAVASTPALGGVM